MRRAVPPGAKGPSPLLRATTDPLPLASAPDPAAATLPHPAKPVSCLLTSRCSLRARAGPRRQQVNLPPAPRLYATGKWGQAGSRLRGSRSPAPHLLGKKGVRPRVITPLAASFSQGYIFLPTRRTHIGGGWPFGLILVSILDSLDMALEHPLDSRSYHNRLYARSDIIAPNSLLGGGRSLVKGDSDPAPNAPCPPALFVEQAALLGFVSSRPLGPGRKSQPPAATGAVIPKEGRAEAGCSLPSAASLHGEQGVGACAADREAAPRGRLLVGRPKPAILTSGIRA